ncbi:hypothetical protein ACI3EY_13955 [Ornithinimicrobium sp. LYQ92]|uniref:SGNH/GDSL hydrolase family protein n=1 Tax=Serinicoccus sp. LYQ92 TaxID=3378798 RepID=UPI0038520150
MGRCGPRGEWDLVAARAQWCLVNGASRVRSTGLGLVVILVNVLIVALIALGFSQRGFSGWWDTLTGDWSTPSVTDPYGDDNGAMTSAPPTQDDAAATTGPPSTPTPEEETEPEPQSVRERYEDGEELTVLVLGDRTGTHENDWVAAWARQLADGPREVGLSTTLPSDPTRYGDLLELGGEGPTLSIYNASMVDGTPGYAADRLDLFVQDDPDLVLVNFGRANTPDNLPEALTDLQEQLSQELPDAEVRYIVQPPRRDGQATVTETVREWGEDEGVDLIDVAQIFEDEGIVDVTVSTRDPLSVNIFGGERWAQIVQSELFGESGDGDQADPSQEDAGTAEGPAPTEGEPEDTGPNEVPLPTQLPVEPTSNPTPFQPPVPPREPPPVSPAPSEPSPTEPTPTDPAEPTAPEPTQPEPTDPGPTDPAPTDPTSPPTDPDPTDPDTESARSPRAS